MDQAIIYLSTYQGAQKLPDHHLKYQEAVTLGYCLLEQIEIAQVVHSIGGQLPASNVLKSLEANPNRITNLLFASWDLIGSDVYEILAFTDQLVACGVRPQAITQPLDLTKPAHRLMVGLYLMRPSDFTTMHPPTPIILPDQGILLPQTTQKPSTNTGLKPYSPPPKASEPPHKIIHPEPIITQSNGYQVKTSFVPTKRSEGKRREREVVRLVAGRNAKTGPPEK